MSAMSRWQAMRPAEPSNVPNPAAGQGWGRVANDRTVEGSMNPQSGSTWHPTVVNLVVLIALELLAYGILRTVFSKALG